MTLKDLIEADRYVVLADVYKHGELDPYRCTVVHVSQDREEAVRVVNQYDRRMNTFLDVDRVPRDALGLAIWRCDRLIEQLDADEYLCPERRL